MAAEELLALAALAGQTVVAAAATDVWGKAKEGFAQLLGTGDRGRAEVAERRLERTRAQLASAPGEELEATRAALAGDWKTRLADLLEEDPGAAAELRILIAQIQEDLPAGIVAAGHGAAVGRDLNVTASAGGVAAGTIHGNVAPGNPTVPGPADR